MNDQKKINGAVLFFTALIVLYEIVTILIYTTDIFTNMNTVVNLIFSQSLIFIPTVIYFIITKQNVFKTIRFKKMHWSSFIIIPIVTIFLQPLLTVINAISLLFVDNYIANVSNSLTTNFSFPVVLVLMAVLPGIVEETAYRGVILENFRLADKNKAIIISGLLFGIMHMNFNQMAYAIVLGIIFGYVVEASGSIISSMIMHFCINGFSIMMSYIYSNLDLGKTETVERTVTNKEYIASIIAYSRTAMFGLIIAMALVFLLARVNGRQEEFRKLFYRHEKSQLHIVNPVLIIVIIYCIGRCVIDEFIIK